MSELGPGSRVDHYAVEAVAGRGGMGVVYRAQDEQLDRPVALKVAGAALAELPELRAGLLREAQLTARVDHPGVVGVHHVGVVDGRPYVALQWIDGGDLRTRLTAGPLEVGEALDVLEQLASALDAAHAAGLLHRDVKPANVLVRDTPDGLRATLTDFGVAGALQAASAQAAPADLVGTPAYLAPELAHGAPGDERSDLYGLACVAFEALTGTPPFVAASVPAMLVAHAVRPRPAASARRPELPREVDEVLARAMAVDPSARFATGSELVAALHHALDLQPGGAPAKGLGPSVRRARRHLERHPAQRRGLLAGLAAAVVAVGLGAGFGGGRAVRDPAPVNRETDLRGVAAVPTDKLIEFPKLYELPATPQDREAVVSAITDLGVAVQRKSPKDLSGTLEGFTGYRIWDRDGSCTSGDDSEPEGFKPAKGQNGLEAMLRFLWARDQGPVRFLGLTPASLKPQDDTSVRWRGSFVDARGRRRAVGIDATRFTPRDPWGVTVVDLCPNLPRP